MATNQPSITTLCAVTPPAPLIVFCRLLDAVRDRLPQHKTLDHTRSHRGARRPHELTTSGKFRAYSTTRANCGSRCGGLRGGVEPMLAGEMNLHVATMVPAPRQFGQSGIAVKSACALRTCTRMHWSTHSEWNMCLQRRRHTLSPD